MVVNIVIKTFENKTEDKMVGTVINLQFDDFAPEEGEIEEFPFAKLEVGDRTLFITKSDLLSLSKVIMMSLAEYDGIEIDAEEEN